MNYQSEKLHVMTVSPLQQLALRMALNEAFKRQAEYLIAAAAAGDTLDGDSMISKFEQQFTSYEICAAGLPSLMSLRYTPHKSLYLTPAAMRYVVDAINNFEPNTMTGGPAQMKAAIENVYPKLKTLINLSSEFTYSMDEIKKAGG